MATGLSLVCGDCGAQLRSTQEAQDHAETSGHTNFSESTEPVLNLVCTECGKPCRSKTETDLHSKRTGHTEFTDRTEEAAKPIQLESLVSPALAAGVVGGAPADSAASVHVDGTTEPAMVVPEVNQELQAELEGMGFSAARTVRALHFSGADNLEAAVNWIVEHEEDPDVDIMPLVPASEAVKKPALTPEEAQAKAKELKEKARKKKEEEEARREKEREKERIRIGKEIQEAKRIEEDQERKRIIQLKKMEKEEEKRAREKILARLAEDKAERRRKLGLPPLEEAAPSGGAEGAPAGAMEPAPPLVKKPLEVNTVSLAEQIRECLRRLKQAHKDDEAKVKRAFQTLLTFVGNVARSPGEERYRRIRQTNAAFQERVGSLAGGVDVLELCGFRKEEDGEFLVLERDRVDLRVLNTAGSELTSAINNPFFGVL